MPSEVVKNQSLVNARERVRRTSDAKNVAKEVFQLLRPSIDSYIKSEAKAQVDRLVEQLQFCGVTLLSGQKMAECLDIPYSTFRKIDKSNWPQIQLEPGGVRYLKEQVIAFYCR